MQKTRIFFVTLDDDDHAMLNTYLATPEEIDNGFFWKDEYISRWQVCDSWPSGRDRLQHVIYESGA